MSGVGPYTEEAMLRPPSAHQKRGDQSPRSLWAGVEAELSEERGRGGDISELSSKCNV